MSAAWASNKLGSPEGWPLPVFRLVDDSRATWASCVPGSSEEWPLLAFRLVVVSMHSGCVCIVVAIDVLFWVVKKGRKSTLNFKLEAFAKLS